QKKTTSKRVRTAVVGLCLSALALTAWVAKGSIREQRLSLSQAQSLAANLSQGSEVPIKVDSSVLYWLNRSLSTAENRRYLRESLERMENYRPMIESKFRKASLPLELLAVPLVESGYENIKGSNGAGAVG